MLSYTSTVTSTDTATDNYNSIESTISCGMKVANFCIDIWHYYGLYTRASGFLKRKGKKETNWNHNYAQKRVKNRCWELT